MSTAVAKISPLMICCQNDSTFSKLMPLSTLAIISAPMSHWNASFAPARLDLNDAGGVAFSSNWDHVGSGHSA